MGCVGSSGSLAQRLEGLDGDAAKALVAKEVQKGLDSRPEVLMQMLLLHDIDNYRERLHLDERLHKEHQLFMLLKVCDSTHLIMFSRLRCHERCHELSKQTKSCERLQYWNANL